MNKTLAMILGVKVKEKEEPGVLGHYDCKPYHNFKYALIYANETEISVTDSVEVYSRVYKDVTFVNVLVNDEKGLDLEKYRYENIKPLLVEKGVPVTEKNIVLMLYQHYNDTTKGLCKKFCNSSKKNFEHACIYNPRSVQMDYFKPVPKFYKLYDFLCEDLYFDLVFIDHSKK